VTTAMSEWFLIVATALAIAVASGVGFIFGL
jgi:hypothetical protein